MYWRYLVHILTNRVMAARTTLIVHLPTVIVPINHYILGLMHVKVELWNSNVWLWFGTNSICIYTFATATLYYCMLVDLERITLVFPLLSWLADVQHVLIFGRNFLVYCTGVTFSESKFEFLQQRQRKPDCWLGVSIHWTGLLDSPKLQ